MTLYLSDSETAPTWQDTLEFTYMPSLNIWMLVDHCKKPESDEIFSGVDCPWSMNFEQYVWYTCDAAFKGVARKPAAEPFNPLERGVEYSLGFKLSFIDHDSKDQLNEFEPIYKPFSLFYDPEGQFAIYSLLSATTFLATTLLAI